MQRLHHNNPIKKEKRKLLLPLRTPRIFYSLAWKGGLNVKISSSMNDNQVAANINLRFTLNTPHTSFRKDIKKKGFSLPVTSLPLKYLITSATATSPLVQLQMHILGSATCLQRQIASTSDSKIPESFLNNTNTNRVGGIYEQIQELTWPT